ncbi:hypothetical protein ACLQ24_27045 [Micromonospora sp. DT4]|uniref:hypothetical protein n=1 Tax=Micromonospora sp. DT4 TaxID=3393438 RepID=UPI003CF17BEB
MQRPLDPAGHLHDRGARDYLRAHGPAVRLVDCADVADDTDVDLPDEAATLPR